MPVPEFAKVLSTTAVHRERRYRTLVPQSEPRRADEHIDHVLDTINRAHSVGRDAFDRLGDQTDVITVEGLEVLIRHRRPLTAQPIPRNQLLANHRVIDLAPHPAAHRCLTRAPDRVDQPGRSGHLTAHRQLDADGGNRSDSRANSLVPQYHPTQWANFQVEFRTDPDRRTLEDGEMACLVDDGWNQLQRGRPRSDHGNAFTRERHIVIPQRGMHERPTEVVHARDVGHLRALQSADRHHTISGGDLLAAVSG
ncbi:Uncharacterised protein [Mycobacteroides abscessus subsp. massiliense]|nr:Uncharacterised protein [Mycobacteroides abscessus subsp. massiliense]